MSQSTATPTLLDGKQLSQQRLDVLKAEIAVLKEQTGKTPKLVVILVGDDPASQVYVNKKAKIAVELGMESQVITHPADADDDVVRRDLFRLNESDTVHGILIQLPLPKHLDTNELTSLILPNKDVDGLHPVNVGKLWLGRPTHAEACTPKGMMVMLEEHGISPKGKHAVILGRSNIVGKPMAAMLQRANATVTMCHSHTPNVQTLCQQADILVAAAGVCEMVKADWVKPGAVVLDVGIHRIEDSTKKSGWRLTGDVDFESVKTVASAITPVPGGVGPMTIAMLMENTVRLFKEVNRIT